MTIGWQLSCQIFGRFWLEKRYFTILSIRHFAQYLASITEFLSITHLCIIGPEPRLLKNFAANLYI